VASSSPRSTSARKSSTRKSAPRNTAKKSDSSSGEGDGSATATSSVAEDGGRRAGAAKAEPRPAARASRVAALAAEELGELTGKGIEGVTGLERTDEGWTVQVEITELRRIPDTTDVLALYEVTTDRQGNLLGYRRLRRYARGAAGNE
jgi:hypothetical protein